MNDQKNTILAIVLSGIVLLGWQYFIGMPQVDKQRQIAAQQQQAQAPNPQTPPGASAPAGPAPQANGPQPPGTPAIAPAGPQQSREQVVAASPRIPIETPRLAGSLALKGGRIDDLSLTQYRETVDKTSPPIVLLSPPDAPQAFYAEFGWVPAQGVAVKVPDANTVWTREGTGALTTDKPVTLTWQNGEGLEFRRTIAVDDHYLFTVKDEVKNGGTAPVSLFPYAMISRHGTPPTLGYYILHEGLIGVTGEDGLQEITYSKIEEKKTIPFNVTNGWLGFTDKYWAATLIPDTDAHLNGGFWAGQAGTLKAYQAGYKLDPQTIAPGATGSANTRLFAGAKEVATVDAYDKALGLNKFDRLIDWGWFYFITKPLFKLIDLIYHWVGNFGVAILLVTVLIKGAFFPLANKSYASMAKMKAVQPQLLMIRERYGDDKMKQQQAMMELYKKEKINPLAGCLPIVVQIPVFFALYKTLFVTIEMRHAPFFGWIHDLSAPDPTNIFNLLGLLPFDPTVVPVIGHFLHLGIWPLIMGITMFVQMKLNPTPPDPTQQMIFNWMPVIFTFMLSSFSSGLVIYWAWNNTLSVLQQSTIMRKHGAKIELFDNIKSLFVRKKPGPAE